MTKKSVVAAATEPLCHSEGVYARGNPHPHVCKDILHPQQSPPLLTTLASIDRFCWTIYNTVERYKKQRTIALILSGIKELKGVTFFVNIKNIYYYIIEITILNLGRNLDL
jgi:hypothetical protein